jgi:hypothetical protein
VKSYAHRAFGRIQYVKYVLVHAKTYRDSEVWPGSHARIGVKIGSRIAKQVASRSAILDVPPESPRIPPSRIAVGSSVRIASESDS